MVWMTNGVLPISDLGLESLMVHWRDVNTGAQRDDKHNDTSNENSSLIECRHAYVVQWHVAFFTVENPQVRGHKVAEIFVVLE